MKFAAPAVLALLPIVFLACNQNNQTTGAELLRFNVRTPPPAYVGEEYNFGLQSVGGTQPYKIRVVKGALPPGLTLVADRNIQGTPSGTENKTHQFTLELSDANLSTKQQEFSIAVTLNPPSVLIAKWPQTDVKGDIKIPLTLQTPKAVRGIEVRLEIPQGFEYLRLEAGEGKPVFIEKPNGRVLRFDAALTQPFARNKDTKTFAYLWLAAKDTVKRDAFAKVNVSFRLRAGAKLIGSSEAPKAPAPATPPAPTAPSAAPPAAPPTPTTPGGPK